MRDRGWVVALLLSLVGLAPDCARAGLFGAAKKGGDAQKVPTNSPAVPAAGAVLGPATNQENVVYQKHRKLSAKEREAFVLLLGKKQLVDEDLRVVARLQAEKRKENEQFAARLLSSYQITEMGSYHFDASNRVIYEVFSPASGTGGVRTAGGTTNRVHRKLKSAEEGRDFVTLVAAKRLTADEVQTLGYLMKEKQLERARFERELLDTFGIRADGRYIYRPGDESIYEIVPNVAPSPSDPVPR